MYNKPLLNKKNVALLICVLIGLFTQKGFSQTTSANGNVGIGTTSPDNSALLDLTSNSKGFLVPRLTLSQRGNIAAPANGLLVYQTDFFSGFYYYDGKQWKQVLYKSSDAAAASAGSDLSWNVGGNSGLSTVANFIGTTDTVSVVFKVNNFRAGLLDYRNGNTSFGYKAAGNNAGLNTVALGALALQGTNSGSNVIAIGSQSLYTNTTGENNIGLGVNSLYSNTTGSRNTALGSYAGFRSVGTGNIFIGMQAGYNETGDNKLYIENSNSTTPLIYGDFATKRIGINTNAPGSALSIDSKSPNTSGLEFKQFTSASPTVKNNTQKVLSIDENGRVILVKDSVGTGSGGGGQSSAQQYWMADGANVKNTPIAGNFDIDTYFYSEKGMIARNLLYVDGMAAGYKGYSGLQLASLWSGAPTFKNNGRVLSVDGSGNVILVKDSIGTGSSAPSYWTNNGGRLETTTGGKVAIGTGISSFPDGYNLFVKGGILTERLRVALSGSDRWADYVFAKNYQLMPLSKVEKYVQANHHLPNVPSAEEMAKNGLDVAETNAKLMEKIEEITLYLIEANKKIENLEKKVENLEAKK